MTTRAMPPFTLLLFFLLAACAPAPRVVVPVESPQAVVYQCADLHILARFEGAAAEVWLPEETRSLRATPAASGVRYAGDGAILWTRGMAEARLDIAGQPSRACLAGPPAPWRAAVAEGVSFRAIGQEPGWMLDILADGGQRLVLDYGTRIAEADSVEVRAAPCRDTMSGHAFPYAVTVTVAGGVLEGCGMGLAAP